MFWPLKSADKAIYRIVPCKCPSLSKGQPHNFDSYVVCEVLHVIAHHAKFLCGDSKVHSLSSCRLFRWVSGATTSGSKVYTHWSLPRPQRSSLVVWNSHAASDEGCEAMATRVWVGLFSTRIQFSLLPRWPSLPKKGSTGEATMRVNSVVPVS